MSYSSYPFGQSTPNNHSTGNTLWSDEQPQPTLYACINIDVHPLMINSYVSLRTEETRWASLQSGCLCCRSLVCEVHRIYLAVLILFYLTVLLSFPIQLY